ncbi:Hypothetical protein I595_1102 [Croceitalea dokdonensis DOKDO 023]|uniref:tRNA modification GTPase n=1 Tax=Croceitalea dokdonensis DOKDO 023 TaxID=1300341 RepID=A0A0N8H486_9FLAO|nr:hypothetical protein [Croceitalea dokdonensis]KPM32676.1 Hypothetical protein I595_1102 [Croceitalea dokdonensis DOKDO 023]
MRKTILLTCLLLFFQTINSQYENGYIITKNGENKIGLIKNQNWINNPERVYFKTNPNESEQTIEITNLSQFGIGNDIKFIVSEVNLDISSENINNLTNNKNPIFERRTLALRKLVDGKISLYEYQFSNGTRYYIKKPNENFEPLVFKKYLVLSNQVGVNEHYKQQLSLLFEEHRDALKKKLINLSYSRKSISKLITEYNLLINSTSTNYFEQINNKVKLNFSIYGGIENTSVSYKFRNLATLNPSFNDISRSMFGAELELLVLNQKLGIFSGYTIKSQVSESVVLQTSIAEITQVAALSYNNNSWSIGARGYIPTIKNLNLIVSAGITVEYVSDFSITLDVSRIDENFLRNGGSEFIGFGLAYKKIFAEARVFSNKMFPENVSNGVPVDDSNINFRIGYKIL